MDSPPPTSSARFYPQAFWINWGLAAMAIILLYGLMPFTSSYDQQVRSLLYTFWLATQSFDGQWEHCLLVPLIIAVIIYLRREEFQSLPCVPAASGFAALALACLCYWMGVRTEVVYLGYISIQLFVGGTILWLAGWEWMKKLAFPYLFLGFAWPLIFLDNSLAFPLRIFMTEISHVFLNIIGVDNLRVGTAIVSAPNPDFHIAQGQKFAVDIANPCSGIRSLFALIMVSALFAYFGLEPDQKIRLEKLRSRLRPLAFWFVLATAQNWRRWVLLAAALPLAVFGNFIRILLLTFGTILFGSPFAIGTMEDPSFFHLFSGFLVYAAALSGMAALWWVLENRTQAFASVRRFVQTSIQQAKEAKTDDY